MPLVSDDTIIYTLLHLIINTASEMIRNDKIAEIIQQRQIKDKQQLNKVKRIVL